MSQPKTDSETFIARIVIEYDPVNGKYSVGANVQDEVLTTGMLTLALNQMKENYQMARIVAMKEKAEKGIVLGVQ